MELEESCRSEHHTDNNDNPEGDVREKKKEDYRVSERIHGEEETIQLSDSVTVSKRTLWMMAGGALGAMALLGLGSVFKVVRPAVVSAVKEGYGFKEWLAAKIEKANEDVQDVIAEAVFSYKKDLTDLADMAKREKELMERVEKLAEERLARPHAEKMEKES